MSSRQPDYGRYQHLESFIHLSKDAIWCYELDIPMPISLSQDEQVEFIWGHSIVRDGNLAMARFYGYQTVQEIIGKYLKDLVTLKSRFFTPKIH